MAKKRKTRKKSKTKNRSKRSKRSTTKRSIRKLKTRKKPANKQRKKPGRKPGKKPGKKTRNKKATAKTRTKVKFQTPKGTFDILPEHWKYWDRVNSIAENISEDYGFSPIKTPIFEQADLFEKGSGPSSDIVQKEMYIFRTKGGDTFALRPEFTPAIVRAYIEHGMKSKSQPVKLYSSGPIFRHEKPQAGRFRQFHQFNLETIGDIDPINDCLLIQTFYLILKRLGVEKFNLQINSIGCPKCRSEYKKLLLNHFRKQRKKLCENCKQRLKTNPLRVFDCKEEKCSQLTNNAPHMIDYLCDECHSHFKEVLEILDEIKIPYLLNSKLVRGLDYYTKTVFEFKLEEDSKMGELCGGGRYDELVKLLGERATPAVGGACGIERIIAILKAQNTKILEKKSPQVFLIQLGELGKNKSLRLFEELRTKRFRMAEAFSKGNIKAQLKAADKSGAQIALIFGQKEALEDNIIIREMESGAQETVPLSRIVKEIKKRLKK